VGLLGRLVDLAFQGGLEAQNCCSWVQAVHCSQVGEGNFLGHQVELLDRLVDLAFPGGQRGQESAG